VCVCVYAVLIITLVAEHHLSVQRPLFYVLSPNIRLIPGGLSDSVEADSLYRVPLLQSLLAREDVYGPDEKGGREPRHHQAPGEYNTINVTLEHHARYSMTPSSTL
jgi:hypothetical protein